MKSVVLTRGQEAQVDDCDEALVGRHKWFAIKRGRTFYAATNVRRDDQSRTVLLMHRFLLGLNDPKIQADHRDGDGLNNTRANLRPCSRHQNQRNTGLRKNNSSGLKGVRYNRRISRFYASIFVNSKVKHLGSFKTKEEAHAAYQAAARQHFGDFARFA